MNNATHAKLEKRTRRHGRIRATVSGTADRPRMAVYRSNKSVYAQLINDVLGVTLAAYDSRTLTDSGLLARARKVGIELAKKARAQGVECVVFDRGGFLFAGSIKEVAEGAREGGLAF